MPKHNIVSIIEKVQKDHPLHVAWKQGGVYFSDFLNSFTLLLPYISGEQAEYFLIEKLQLKPEKVEFPKYYQGAVEASVIFEFLRRGPESFVYEPTVAANSKKNVEFCSKLGAITYYVEAKCSDFTEWEAAELNSNIKLSTAGRIPGHAESLQNLQNLLTDPEKIENPAGVEVLKNKDNSLKTFFQEAHLKFPDPKESSLNLLFVGLGKPPEIQKWANYLYESKGLYTDAPFASPETYNKLDVLIFTNLYYRHKYFDTIQGSAWDLSNTLCLIMSSRYRRVDNRDAILEFAKLLQDYSDELRDYRALGDVPPEVERVVRIPHFINKLKERGIEHF